MFQACDVEGVRELIQLLQIKSDFLNEKSTEPPPAAAQHSQDKELQRQSETQPIESCTDSSSSVIGKEVVAKPSSEEVSSECSVSSEKSGTKSGAQELPVPVVQVKTEAAEDQDDQDENDERLAEEDGSVQDLGKRQRFTPARRRSSLNPVNLSLSNPDQSADSPRSPSITRSGDVGDSSDTVAKVCYFEFFFYAIVQSFHYDYETVVFSTRDFNK